MTAEEYWKHIFDEEPQNNAQILACVMMEEYARDYALRIARKAVVEVLYEYMTVGLVSPAIIAGGILKRIKTEIGGEG